MLIKNGFVVTMDSLNRLLPDGAVYAEKEKIIDVGRTSELEKTYKADEVIDARKGVVMPGFVNSHVHFTSVLRRGLGDNLPLEQWLASGSSTQAPSGEDLGTTRRLVLLGRLTTIQRLTPEEQATAFRLVLLEMIKAGVTCYSAGVGSLRERYESGLRAFNALLLVDKLGDYGSILQTIRENYSDRFQFGLGPQSTLAPDKKTMLEVKEVAERLDLKIHMHVAENREEIKEIKRKHGCDGAIEYLDRLGLLSPRLVAAHCVHVSPTEIDLMQTRGVGVAHCPVSNAKLGDGIAPLASFLKAKIPLGLGSDGPATNNCVDMFQEMKFACLLQRAVHCDPTVVKAEEVLRMATIGGAGLLGIEDQIGSIEVGKKADIIIVDFEKPHLYPKTNMLSHLVYSARASDVNTTIVDGKIVMRDRKVKTMDEASVLKEAQRAYEALSSRK